MLYKKRTMQTQMLSADKFFFDSSEDVLQQLFVLNKKT
jgi:hypothetical protein